MRILCDVDGVLGMFPNEVLRFCNLYGEHGHELPWSINDVTDHDVLKALRCEYLQARLDQHMIDTDFCRHMPMYPGAQDFVESLRGLGEVVIVTSSYAAVPNWDSARRAWLLEKFEIPKRDVIFTSRKDLVRGDWLIDDRAENCEAFGDGAICLDRPWNQKFQGSRAKNYEHAIWMLNP